MTLRGVLESAFGNFLCLRGYAPYIDVASISRPDESYQRPWIANHRDDIVTFIDSGEYTFFPEVVLGASLQSLGIEPDKLDSIRQFVQSGPSTLRVKSDKVSIRLSAKQTKVVNSENTIGYDRIVVATLEKLEKLSDENKLFRIDGNHRLSAAFDAKPEAKRYKIPFAIVLFGDDDACRRFGRVFFHMINFRAEPIVEEQNLKLILDTDDFLDDRLLLPPFGVAYYLTRKFRENDRRRSDSIVRNVTRTTLLHLFQYLLRNNVLEQSKPEEALVGFEWSLGVFEGMIGNNAEALQLAQDENALAAMICCSIRSGEEYQAFVSWLKRNRKGRQTRDAVIPFQTLLDMFAETRVKQERTIFVSMQFGSCGTEQHFKTIQKVVSELNTRHHFDPPLKVVRIDQIVSGATFEINAKIISEICGCGHLIADLTYCNSNVYHEVGLLMGRTLALTGKQEYGMTLLLDENVSQENKIVKFNISSLQQLRFKEESELREGLLQRLQRVFGVE